MAEVYDPSERLRSVEIDVGATSGHENGRSANIGSGGLPIDLAAP